jgi:hypothetical protein
MAFYKNAEIQTPIKKFGQVDFFLDHGDNLFFCGSNEFGLIHQYHVL